MRVWDTRAGNEAGASLIGHTGWIRDIALSESGTLASASDDCTIRLWRLSAASQAVRLAGHRNWVTAMAFLSGGASVVSASADATLKIWDIATGLEQSTLAGHASRVTSLAVDGDDGRIISASDDGTLRVWTARHGAGYDCVQAVSAHTGPVNAVAVGGGLIVSGSSDYTMKVWDRTNGTHQQTMTGHRSKIRAVACTRDGHTAVSAAADGRLILWNLATGWGTELTAGGPGIKALTVLESQRLVASGADDGTLSLWSLDEPRLVYSNTDHARRVDAIDAVGDLIVSASSDTTVKVWQLELAGSWTLRNLATFYGDSGFYACAMGARGELIAAGDASGAVHFLSLVRASEARM
jgi:WD40 repeat protein